MINKPQDAAFGFLTVVEDPQYGFFGGCLLLNATGRPSEFHCTAPVRPNRAQQILYGPTLRAYLYGEQIAAALIDKSRAVPQVIFLDQVDALSVRPLVEMPVVLVKAANRLPDPPMGTGREVQQQLEFSKIESQITWKSQILSTLPEYMGELEEVRRCLEERQMAFDLLEPFDRIREAIAEARKAAGQG